jgi:hypothetical protein
MNEDALTCQLNRRRDRVRNSALMGLDYLEVSPDQLTLTVWLLGNGPQQIQPANVRICGGERVRDIEVESVVVNPETDANDASLKITVNQPGDYSLYTLSLVALDGQGRATDAPMAGFDSRYASLKFSFKAACPSDLDCREQKICPPPKRVEPDPNYLAKDYSSFRQLILDRLAVLMPGWQELHAPDIGIMLVEVLAYVGDYLSYYQDAVATEAYLETAQRRISVRRHARLVDYRMHEGCNARAWICLQTDSDVTLDPLNVAFLCGLELPPALAEKSILSWDDLRGLPDGAYEVFEMFLADSTALVPVRAAHSRIRFYTWGDKLCCLPAGATQATLIDEWGSPQPAPENPDVSHVVPVQPPARKLQLQPGDVLIFEEVKGPNTGNPADADPSRRWAVRLTRVTPAEDPLFLTADGRPTPVVNIEWSAADALPFPFCLSARLPAPDCSVICDVSVVCGNVVLVDHGRTLDPEPLGQVEEIDETGECQCEGSAVEMTPVAGVFRPAALRQSPLTFRQKLVTRFPTSAILQQDPRCAMPQITLTGWPGVCTAPDNPAPPKVRDGINPADPQWIWRAVRDLLESAATDQNFVVEMDDTGNAWLRFGDGILGRMPEACMIFQARYRVGNGPAGNVGADTITRIVLRNTTISGVTLTARNPFPAQGGTEREPVDEVKLFAPGAFRKVLERAVTAADYATLAERSPLLQQAAASLRWTGSWFEAQVAVDPLGSEIADDTLLRRVRGHLHRFVRMGHDLVVEPARYVPLQITLTICVLPQYQRGHVEAALLDVFSNRVLSDGRLGFFHPDNLTFGTGIYRSRIIAAAQAVPGVRSVKVKTFQKLFEPAEDGTDTGVLRLGPGEIAQLDNDPGFPEHGVLTLEMGGGR